MLMFPASSDSTDSLYAKQQNIFHVSYNIQSLCIQVL
jgi:hypothetical protein